MVGIVGFLAPLIILMVALFAYETVSDWLMLPYCAWVVYDVWWVRRLLGYDLLQPARLWEDEADCGFWSWSRQGSMVLMAAELEFAAGDLSGRKVWSRFVEPPWEFAVAGEVLVVDVMGAVSRIDLQTGEPTQPGAAADGGM